MCRKPTDRVIEEAQDKIDGFYNALRSIQQQKNFTPNQILNMDEIGNSHANGSFKDLFNHSTRSF